MATLSGAHRNLARDHLIAMRNDITNLLSRVQNHTDQEDVFDKMSDVLDAGEELQVVLAKIEEWRK